VLLHCLLICGQVLQAKPKPWPELFLLRELQPASSHAPVTTPTEMLDDSTLKCGALRQRVQLFRALGAEDEMKDGLVVVACPWNDREPLLKGKDVRISRKIFGQLFVEHP
jgi:hypothetical protein